MPHGDTPTPPPSLLTERGVADVLLLTPRTVRNLATRGELPRVKIGRATRYRREDVDALIARGLQRPDAGDPSALADEMGMVR